MSITDQSDKKDIAILGSTSNLPYTFHVVHGKSGESASVTLGKLKDVKSGDVITGDFNINFLDEKNVAALRDWLISNKLYMDMSAASIEQLVVFLKIRSVNSLYSQQLVKNGLVDVFIKDLPPFKVMENTDGRDPLPAELVNTLKSLSLKAKKVESQIKDPNDFASINALCRQNGMVSYHDLNQSFGNDHPNMYYVDEENKRIILIQNSIEHIAYDLEGHFEKPVDSEVAKALYLQYDGLVWSEFYKLLAKRDQTPLSAWDKTHQLLFKENKTREEVNQIKDACTKKLKTVTKIKNNVEIKIDGAAAGALTKAEISEYYKNILESKELNQINQLLKKKFDLSTPESRNKYLENLVSDKNMDKYKTKISEVLNAVYQGLSPDRAKKGEPTVSLNGNGFLPFVDADGKVIPVEDVHTIQVNKLKRVMKSLHKEHPDYELSLAIIEGQADGKKQEPKCSLLEKALEDINSYLDMPELVDLTPSEDAENWNFWLDTGIVLGATLSGAAFAIAAMALASVIVVPVAGIVAAAAVGAVAAGLSIYGMFQYKDTCKNESKSLCSDLPEDEFQDSLFCPA